MLLQAFFAEEPAMANANGVLQSKPPARPNTANCHSGSEPDAPIYTPKTGMSKVKYAVVNNITILNLVTLATMAATREGRPESP